MPSDDELRERVVRALRADDAEAVLALARPEKGPALAALREALEDPSPVARENALVLLSVFKDEEGRDRVVDAALRG